MKTTAGVVATMLLIAARIGPWGHESALGVRPSHGFIDRPLPEWVEPVVKWAQTP
jgi:hypothetical protein